MTRIGNGPALLLALLLAACAAGPRAAVVQAGPGAGDPAADGDPVTLALGAALARGAWEDLRIDAECNSDAGWRSATLFGTGVGIWDRRRQFAVAQERLAGVLKELEESGFGRLRESYGGKGDPAAAFAVELLCRVRLELNGVEKEVRQLSGGRQLPELRRLAEAVLAVAEELGRSGEAAATLDEGLEKIARGELAPETLVLQIQVQSEDPGSQEGWLLRIDGGAAELLSSSTAEGWSEPTELRLSREEIASLARSLAGEAIASLPVNLYAPLYVDLSMEVLGRSRSLQARRFAGMTAETHGEAQRRFDRIYSALERFRETKLAGGRE